MDTDGKMAPKSGDNGRDEHGLTPAQRTWPEHFRRCKAEGVTFAAFSNSPYSSKIVNRGY